MPYAEGKGGPLLGQQIAFGSDGKITEERFTPEGAQYVADLLPRYAEWVRRGNVFVAANQAGQAISALAAAMTGVVIFNPLDSGKVVIPLILAQMLSAAPAAASIIGWSVSSKKEPADITHTTPLTPKNVLIGSTVKPVATADASATLAAAPVAVLPIGGVVAVGSITPPTMLVDLGGLFTLLPGYAGAFFASAAASGLGAVIWLELPLQN